MDEDTTQKLQEKVDKIKTLNLISNAHNLSPPTKKDEENINQIAIVTALSSTPRLLKVFLEARGMMFDEKKKELIQVSRPYMNVDGAWRLVQVCKQIAENAEWSNFEEDKIPYYLDHFFRINYPYFTFWNVDYDLNESDFNYIETTLQMFMLGSFYKAKGGKQLNILGRTYSEDFMGRVLQDQNQKKKEGFLDKYNPFKKIE